MKTIYIDAYAGVAGDMMAGALFSLLASSAGAETAEKMFRAELKKLPIEGFEIELGYGVKGGISGTAFRVREHHHHDGEDNHHHHRGLKDIQEILTGSTLSVRVVRDSLRAFLLLAEAEAKVHGTTIDEIHFHEVGAIDSIADIVSSFILIELLGYPRVISSPLNVGSGTVRCAHGVLPVPAPATVELLRDIPIYSLGSPMERVTPTGALLVRSFASAFAAVPPGRVISVGYGLGEKDCPDIPNALRLILLDSDKNLADESDFCVLLEANIDDMNPQDFSLAFDRLFEAGALDVWSEPIFMKKNRPAQKFCCLSPLGKEEDLSEIILLQTTTQGVRRSTMPRRKLSYKIEEVETPIGKTRVKTATMRGVEVRRTPEYEDLKRIAQERSMSLFDVRAEIAKYI